jgi:adenylate kinase
MRHYKKSKIKNQKSKIIIILGPPGSGKGTQSKLLCKKFDLEFFGAGGALRQRQKISDFTGRKLKEVMGKGKWVPNFIISKIWMDELEKFKRKRKFNGLVSEGSPRRIIEAELFDEALNWYEWQEKVEVIFINISRKESFNRLTKRRQCKKCGRLIPWIGEFKKLKNCDKCKGELIIRNDDKPVAIKKRLEEFNEKTMPVIEHYKKQKKLIKINGEQSIEKVFQDILKAMK